MGDLNNNKCLLTIAAVLKHVGLDRVRAYEEGERVLRAGHVRYCGITKRILNKTHIFALCLVSTNPHSEIPYEINIEITEVNDSEKKVTSCTCKCPAGPGGRCKHSVAVLLFLSRTSVTDIEEATCTDAKQQWGCMKSNIEEMYATVPVSQFCHLNEKSSKVQYLHDPTKEIDFLAVLTKGMDINNCNVEVIKVKAGYRSSIDTAAVIDKTEMIKEIVENIFARELPLCSSGNFIIYENLSDESVFTFDMLSQREKDFYLSRVALDAESAVNLCLKTIYQNNEIWYSERKVRITASKAYLYYTYVSNKKQDWDKRIKDIVCSSFKGNKNTRYGILMEERALKAYMDISDFTVEEIGLIVHPCLPWLGYSPDGIVVNSHIVEIKCPVEGKKCNAYETAKKLPYIKKLENEALELRKRHLYYCQVQLGMFLTGLDCCHFVIYSSFDDSCYVIEIEYEQDLVFNEYLPKLQFVYFSKLLQFLADPINNIMCENCDENSSPNIECNNNEDNK